MRLVHWGEGGRQLRVLMRQDYGFQIERKKWDWVGSDDGGGEGWSAVLAADQVWGVAKMNQPRFLPSDHRSHSTHTLRGTTQPSQTPLFTLSRQWKCSSTRAVSQNWADPPDSPRSWALLMKPTESAQLTSGGGCIDFDSYPASK